MIERYPARFSEPEFASESFALFFFFLFLLLLLHFLLLMDMVDVDATSIVQYGVELIQSEDHDAIFQQVVRPKLIVACTCVYIERNENDN